LRVLTRKKDILILVNIDVILVIVFPIMFYILFMIQVSNMMQPDEYVYIIARDMKTGRVITLQDNRDRLEIEMEALASAPGLTAVSIP
jgi:hypothetical protein